MARKNSAVSVGAVTLIFLESHLVGFSRQNQLQVVDLQRKSDVDNAPPNRPKVGRNSEVIFQSCGIHLKDV